MPMMDDLMEVVGEVLKLNKQGISKYDISLRLECPLAFVEDVLKNYKLEVK